MFGVLLAVVLGVVLYAIVSRWTTGLEGKRALLALTGGYVLRLILQTFLRDIPFFSHGVGGDNETYEHWARAIVLIWEHSGFEYITQEQFWQLGQTSLPSNLFALVYWANGGPTRVGCTALVAFAACLTCFNLYKLALEFGAEEGMAVRVLVLLLFGPAFLMYTSEMYKDGLVAFFVVGALGSAFRLSRKFSLLHVAIGVISLLALWQVRYYLGFVTVGRLLVGLSGLTSRSSDRPVMASLLFVAVGLFLTSYTSMLDSATDSIGATFDIGTSREAIDEKAAGGSGVLFDDGGSPFGALHLKTAYMLLAPFPWQTGTIGLQIGKIDALVWYYLLYHAIVAGRRLFREDRQLLLMFLVFLVPTSLMYAVGMSNVGLAVRQRIPIVLFGGMLAAMSLRRKAIASEEGVAEADQEAAEPGLATGERA